VVLGAVILPIFSGYWGSRISSPIVFELVAFWTGWKLYRSGNLAGLLPKVVFAVAVASIFPCYFLGQWCGAPRPSEARSSPAGGHAGSVVSCPVGAEPMHRAGCGIEQQGRG
jgi:hypothetical protein